MKKTLLTILAGMAVCMASATPAQGRLENGPARQIKYEWEGTDTLKYFVGAQSFMKGWQFDVNGGDSKTYEIGVVHDGTKVVFTNLFNSYDPSTGGSNFDLPIEGVYDSAAGTITFDAGLNAVSLYGYYLATLKAVTEFNADGTVPDGAELGQVVFNVTPDFKTITAANYFGAQYAYGWADRFKTFTATKEDPNDPPHVVKVGDDIAFGQTYPGMAVTKTFAIMNTGGQAADYVITVESDDDAFTATSLSGAVQPYSQSAIEFQFNPSKVGTFEGLATIEFETGDPILVKMDGEAIALPDYSGIVKHGDFTFETVVDYPALVEEVDHPLFDADGNPIMDGDVQKTEKVKAAKMCTKGVYAKSTFKAKFNVPEGKIGKLSYKGFLNNPTNITWKGQFCILYDDMDQYDDRIYQLTADVKPEHCNWEFAPGDHYVYFVMQDAQSREEDYFAAIYDLDLQIEDVVDESPTVDNNNLFLGYGIAGDGYETEKVNTLIVTNHSSQPMKIVSVTCDNEEFDFSIPTAEVGLLESIKLPIEMLAKTAGEKVANYTIETTTGTCTAQVTATCGEYPDYASLVTEGAEAFDDFEVNGDFPFIVEDGKAYNLSSKHPDAGEVYSTFQFTVTVPEGMVGQFHFKGHSWGTPEDMYSTEPYWDFGGLWCELAQPISGSSGFTACFYDNDVDVDENYWATKGDPIFTAMTELPAGVSTLKFFYEQMGDSKWYGEDRLEIYSMGVTLGEAGIDTIDADKVVSKEYFNLSGIRVTEPANGIFIERAIYSDGTVVARKVLKK
ncbi:MAG: hypothetical protein HUK13_03225 [Muribaculaceae bacterium]|nr:hypothetical protein [Muribaculaceae bacterium]